MKRYARTVQFRIKPGKEKAFCEVFVNEILPMLRDQLGFQQEVMLLGPEGSRAISLWDEERAAEAYKAATYQQVLAKLSAVIDGTPTVETCETADSYAHAPGELATGGSPVHGGAARGLIPDSTSRSGL